MSETNTSTQIRNFYSEGISYLNIKFYNTNLSFKFSPFVSKDPGGISKYDLNNSQTTTVDYEGAYALYEVAEDIIKGKITECNLPIPCAAGATLTIERKIGISGQMETIFSIQKNNVTIPFVFKTINQQVKENGQFVTRVIECGLGAFKETIKGYLNGINSDRHLDKLTDDFAKSQNQSQNPQQNYGNNYKNNYKKPYNNGGYKKPYNGNNNGYNNQNNQSWGRQQDMSSYNIKN